MGLSKEKIAEILSVNDHYDMTKWEYHRPNDSFLGSSEYGSCKIPFESGERAANAYLDGAIKEINEDMNAERKNYIVGFLNANAYTGFTNWAVDGKGFFAESHCTATRIPFDKIESRLQDHREFLAGQGCVPHEPEDIYSETNPGVLDIYDEDYNPIPSKVVERLKLIGDKARKAKDFDINETLNAAIDLIAKLRNDESIESNPIPSADEALDIINEANHSDTTWSIVALGHDDNGERNAFLLYEELIGTAMYYKARGAK